ncbi:MAG TPA: hypothetical protein V6D30_03670 [Leptolyngbyaceae cyanobacterium]
MSTSSESGIALPQLFHLYTNKAMGQLFDRISRAVKANLNNSECEDLSDNTGEGAAFIAGGAEAGALVKS